MKKSEFWEQVNQRVRENSEISRGGLPPVTARLTEWVGLRFLPVGLILSFVLALWVWIRHYEGLIQAVRLMIWR